MRKTILATVMCAAIAAWSTPALPQEQAQQKVCQRVVTSEFIRLADTAVAEVHGAALHGIQAVRFAEDAHTGIEPLAVYVVPTRDGADFVLVIVFNAPDGSGGIACVVAPDGDDRAAVKKHIGVRS